MARDSRAGHGRDELIGLIRTLIGDEVFDPTDFVLAGSARLLLDGVLDTASDLDVVARGSTYERAMALTHRPGHGGLVVGASTGDKIAQLYGGRVNVSARWIDRNESIDDLIDGADLVDGLRCFHVDEVIAYKRLLDRPKDRADLARLEAVRAR